MEFEWDEEKAKLNAQKHGVTFEEAELAFYDENAVILFDDTNYKFEYYDLLATIPRQPQFQLTYPRQSTLKLQPSSSQA